MTDDPASMDKPEAVRMMLVPEHPTYEQLAKMSGPWCCTVEEMAESWAELLDNIEATPSQDASALVEALQQAKTAMDEYYRYWTGGETRGSYDGKPERAALWAAMYKARAALTAWEAQHG